MTLFLPFDHQHGGSVCRQSRWEQVPVRDNLGCNEHRIAPVGVFPGGHINSLIKCLGVYPHHHFPVGRDHSAVIIIGSVDGLVEIECPQVQFGVPDDLRPFHSFDLIFGDADIVFLLEILKGLEFIQGIQCLVHLVGFPVGFGQVKPGMVWSFLFRIAAGFVFQVDIFSGFKKIGNAFKLHTEDIVVTHTQHELYIGIVGLLPEDLSEQICCFRIICFFDIEKICVIEQIFRRFIL